MKKKRKTAHRRAARRAPKKIRAKRTLPAALVRALAGAPLLRGAPLAVARELLAECRRRELVTRELLLLPNQPNSTLYLLLHGKLHVLLGESQDTIVQMLPGTCVGEMSVIDGAGVSAPVLAAEPSTLLAIDTRRFWRMADRYPVIGRNLLSIMAQRVRKTNSALRTSLRAHDQQGQLARIDILTSARNRRWLDENLPQYIDESRDGGPPLMLGLFDIDHFKKYNDTWGHAAGDAALRAVSQAVRDRLRPDDRLCRYGGEEFCVLLSGGTVKAISRLAERLLEAIARTPVQSRGGDPLPSVTASLGLAAARPEDTPESLLHRTDQALYQAKRGGRNRYVLDRT